MKGKNSTVVLLCYTRLVEYQLAKRFINLEQKSKNLSSVPNEAKQTIHAINVQDSDFAMDFYTAL